MHQLLTDFASNPGPYLEKLRQSGEPLVLTMPYRPEVDPEERSEGFTMCISGATAPFRQAFDKQGEYWLKATEPPSPITRPLSM